MQKMTQTEKVERALADLRKDSREKVLAKYETEDVARVKEAYARYRSGSGALREVEGALKRL